jgi:hypothetical protein
VILKLLVFAGFVVVLVSLFSATPSEQARVDKARRRAAWRAAMRRTAFTVGACLFLVATLFGTWHGWRFGDASGWVLGAIGAPGALACAFLAWRAGRLRPDLRPSAR